jgi:peroxiredoxin
MRSLIDRRVFTVLALFLALTLFAACGKKKDEPTPEETNLVQVGQMAPDFAVSTIDGGAFSLSANRGKVLLVNWFATWCPPCIEEMPYLEKEVWTRFRGDDFAMVSVAREETLQVVAPFVEKHGISWPVALDPHRKVYAAYAESFIPRNYVIDREGKVVFQSQGFEMDEFEEMIEVIVRELAKPAPVTSPLEAHLGSLGSAADREKITSVTALAQTTSPNGPYTTLLQMAPGGRIHYLQTRGDVTEFEVVLNGAKGWPAHEPEAQLGDDTWWVIRCHAFQLLALDPNDWFTGYRKEGDASFGGRSCARWTARDPFDVAVDLYFDAQTGLLAGIEMPNAMDEGTVALDFREWRTVAGVQLPSKVVATDRQGDFILDFTEITMNDVDLNIFEGAAN